MTDVPFTHHATHAAYLTTHLCSYTTHHAPHPHYTHRACHTTTAYLHGVVCAHHHTPLPHSTHRTRTHTRCHTTTPWPHTARHLPHTHCLPHTFTTHHLPLAFTCSTTHTLRTAPHACTPSSCRACGRLRRHTRRITPRGYTSLRRVCCAPSAVSTPPSAASYRHTAFYLPTARLLLCRSPALPFTAFLRCLLPLPPLCRTPFFCRDTPVRIAAIDLPDLLRFCNASAVRFHATRARLRAFTVHYATAAPLRNAKQTRSRL